MADSASAWPEIPEVEFLTKYSNISKEEALARIEQVKDALRRDGQHLYKCIEHGTFGNSKINRHPFYRQLLELSRSPDFRFLELGCCFGVDTRKLIHDGVDPAKLSVSDLSDVYWNLGRDILFAGDEPSVERVFGDFTTAESSSDLPHIVSAHGWVEKFDAVSAFAILHCLSKEQTDQFLVNCFQSLKWGGNLIGWCVGTLNSAGSTTNVMTPTKGLPGREERPRFLHTADSLLLYLHSIGFSQVRVTVSLRHIPGADNASYFGELKPSFLVFSATKLKKPAA
ncbi:uncharacterized protein BJ171DRAFT_594969 [Polychytrium aggregatum]|uniref:uncharacterized protein n=1 Tax=Polychytrium aggregatum TaxID=110093 RepID=UPI0022FE92DC|nr:uncharacterized protein BJ171DRAFT_594969 [Polychytrium aggregatum]KAI9209192.1 hypothetical protein BJ171DRAFT_594969 [Polychytrium aggregatum]